MSNVEVAKKLFEENYLCSQAVFAAYATEYGLTEEQALKIGACFGSGMCRGEVCGAVTGALMVIGLKYGQGNVEEAESRAKTNRLTCRMMDRFKEVNGSYTCRDLLGCDLSRKEDIEKVKEAGLFVSFCPKMVESAAKILEEILVEED